MRNAQDRGEAPLVPTPRTTTMTALGKQVFVSEVNEIKQVDQFDDYDPRSDLPESISYHELEKGCGDCDYFGGNQVFIK